VGTAGDFGPLHALYTALPTPLSLCRIASERRNKKVPDAARAHPEAPCEAAPIKGSRVKHYRVRARDSFFDLLSLGRCFPPSCDGPSPDFRASDLAFALDDFFSFGMLCPVANSGAKFAHPQ
jgi:hypothetical protein